MDEPEFYHEACKFYEAAERLSNACDYLLSHVYPAKVFIGCTECCDLTCDCDSGVQAIRRLCDALANYMQTERDEE